MVVETSGAALGVAALDPDSGARIELSSRSIGAGPLGDPGAIAWDPKGRSALVVDDGLNALLVIDPVSGDRVIVSRW